jgi:single-strand DNA-binding protein
MSLNKAMLIGRLGKDPELRYTKSGSAVANFTMATDESYKDSQGNKQEKTEWHSVVAWGKLAEFVQNYLKKGREVYVEGRIQTRDYTDKENIKRYKTEINARDIRFVGPKPDGAARGASSEEGGGPSGGGSGRGGGGGPPSQPPPAEDYIEDDIPF